MRHLPFILVSLLVGCMGPMPDEGGDDGTGSATGSGSSGGSDSSGTGSGSGSGSGTTQRACPLPASTPATGALTATKSQMCNVPGSQGAQHWYRLAATLPGGATDYVQLDLWDNKGAFAGGTVKVGTYPITGNDAAYATCGICVRGLGDKGTTGQKEYFATGGTVNVTAIGGNGLPIAATLSNLTLVEVDATTHAPVASGCTASVASTQVSGTVVQVAGGGGGGGGGGGACPATVGD
jgi:hypothetical protein